MSELLLTTREVVQATGLGRTTLWRMRERGQFPQPLKVGPHNVFWRHSEVHQWLRANPPAPRVRQ